MFRLRARPAPLIHLDQVAELIATVTRPVTDANVVLYGSTVRERRVVGDIDIWVEGDACTIGWLANEFAATGRERGLCIDLVVADDPTMAWSLSAAVRWCVHREGLAVTGTVPRQPIGMTYETAEHAYRQAIAQNACEIAQQAEIYARAALPSAGILAEASVRGWVRSAARDRAAEKQMRRLSGEPLLLELTRLDPVLASRFAQRGWCECDAVIRLAQALRTGVASNARLIGLTQEDRPDRCESFSRTGPLGEGGTP